ncbi:hypothetical protein [Fundidesulfovibrio agrisoli]|uniref:hypothetical protein n=1 Tax=Fundidesulfovibrio agrisoli TaxID=2922717 RepID=UPI001FAD8153|nr:hypothetical protein [Fundidesulfovibrio agrisoli]
MEDDVREQIAEAEREIASFQVQMETVAAEIKRLMADEDPAAGVSHAGEIHAARQERLRLEFEIKFRKGRINRLRFG